MGRWIRVDVQWHDDPKAIKARGWGMVVVRAVWEIVKAKYSAGTMPAECWDAEYIARWSLFYEERGGVRGIERGMTQALASGMLERGDDGSIVVPNWRRYQVDATAAERKAKHLSKKTAHLQGDGTGENGSERKARLGTTDRTRQDKTRHTHRSARPYTLLIRSSSESGGATRGTTRRSTRCSRPRVGRHGRPHLTHSHL